MGEHVWQNLFANITRPSGDLTGIKLGYVGRAFISRSDVPCVRVCGVDAHASKSADPNVDSQEIMPPSLQSFRSDISAHLLANPVPCLQPFTRLPISTAIDINSISFV